MQVVRYGQKAGVGPPGTSHTTQTGLGARCKVLKCVFSYWIGMGGVMKCRCRVAVGLYTRQRGCKLRLAGATAPDMGAQLSSEAHD